MKQHPVEPSQGGRPQNEQAVPAVGSPPEHAQPDYWQWRMKGEPWTLERTFNSQVHATTPNSEVRGLYAAPPEHADLLGELRAAREAVDLGLDYAKTDLRERQQMYRNYPHRYATEMEDVSTLESALARIDTVLKGAAQ